MQKLHPKAVWLFFFQFLLFGFLVIIPLSIGIASGLIEFSRFPQNEAALGLIWGSVVLTLFLPPLLYAIFCYIWAKLTYQFWRYQLDRDVIRIEKGVIWKKYVSIPYERIQNVDIYRGVFARILGLSDLHIQTAGYSGQLRAEGKLPGLDSQVAEKLRDELIKKVKGTRQGL